MLLELLDGLLDFELLELLDDLLDFEFLEEPEPDFEALEDLVEDEFFFELFSFLEDASDLDEEPELLLLAFSFLDAESPLFEAAALSDPFSFPAAAEAVVSAAPEVSLVFEAVFPPEVQEQDAINTAIKALTPTR